MFQASLNISHIALFSVLFWITFRRIKVRDDSSPLHHMRCLNEIHLILNPPHTSERELLLHRADANERLKAAFRLANTFVSEDPEVHHAFVRRARRLLNSAQREGWKSFRDVSTRAIQATYPLPCCRNEIPFDVFIQSVTLRVILVGLLGVDKAMEDFDQSDISIVASHITSLWALSKTGCRIPPSILIELITSLRRLVPDEDGFPNPLDYVIPAWETLWRVVAIAVAHTNNETKLRTVFKDFFSHPGDAQFRSRDYSGVCVKDIIYESMRLHPPSKRIGRVVLRSWARLLPASLSRLMKNTSLHRFVYHSQKANIIDVQRSSSLWGPSADIFDPHRHQDTTPEKEQILRLVFGYGPHRCIGESWAPIAAGVISSAILESLGGGGWSIVEGSDIGGRSGWDGWAVVRG